MENQMEIARKKALKDLLGLSKEDKAVIVYALNMVSHASNLDADDKKYLSELIKKVKA
jgi:phage-related protein